MTSTDLLVIVGICLVVVPVLLLAVPILVLAWISRGEPGANGDPERDSGLSDFEVQRRIDPVERWDSGSSRTAAAAHDLDAARSENTRRMRHLFEDAMVEEG